MVSFPIFVAAAAQTVRQFREIKGIENTTPIGGGALMAPGFLEAAGDTAVDLVFTNPDTAPDAMGNRYRELLEIGIREYREVFFKPCRIIRFSVIVSLELVRRSVGSLTLPRELASAIFW